MRNKLRGKDIEGGRVYFRMKPSRTVSTDASTFAVFSFKY